MNSFLFLLSFSSRAVTWFAILIVFSSVCFGQRFHGASITKNPVGPSGQPIAHVGETITAVIRVRNLDDFNDSLVITSIVDIVRHTSGSVTSMNLLSSNITLPTFGSQITVTNTYPVLTADGPILVDDAQSGGIDNHDGDDPGTGIPQNFFITFRGQIRILVTILAQPHGGAVRQGSNVDLIVSAAGGTSLFYQWRRYGVDIPNATNATLTLNSVGAADSACYSVLVWNSFGSVESQPACLAVLTDGANDNQPTQPAYSLLPPYQSGSDSLVFVTHGRTEGGVVDHPWVNDIAAAIQNEVQAAGNWMVVPFKWVEEARADIATVIPRANRLGKKVGDGINTLAASTPNHQWSHVHLIAHSAGAELIEAAAARIQKVFPTTEIHCTFLDPYNLVIERYAYGFNANWAENYFVHDDTTALTEGRLSHAHNVDVGWVDDNAHPVAFSLGGRVAYSRHGFPVDFYLASVRRQNKACADDYGFARSKEAGGWADRGNYPKNNSPVLLCAPVDAASSVQKEFFALVNQQLQFNLIPSATSPFGVNLFDSSFSLSSSSPQQNAAKSDATAKDAAEPAWLAIAVAVSNRVNFIQADAGFADTNGEGLVTIYWNTNQIGLIDQRVTPPGLDTYQFSLPAVVTTGLYTLSFRLDSFNGTASSITVTNVTTGFAGLEQPFTLAVVGSTNRIPTLKLTGASNFNYLLQSSTNLVDWTPSALLLNTNGTVLFTDTSATNSAQRFYRAVLP